MDNLGWAVLISAPVVGILGLDYYFTKKESERVNLFTNKCVAELKKYEDKKVSNIRFDPNSEEFIVSTNDSIGVRLGDNSGIDTALRSSSKKYLNGKRYYNVDFNAVNGSLVDGSFVNNQIGELRDEVIELRSYVRSLNARMTTLEFRSSI